MIRQTHNLVAVAGLLLTVPAMAQQQQPLPTTAPDPATPTVQPAPGDPTIVAPDGGVQPDGAPAPDSRTAEPRRHDGQVSEEGKAPRPESPQPRA